MGWRTKLPPNLDVRFSEISSPEDFILREHLLDLAATRPEVGKRRTITRTSTTLIAGVHRQTEYFDLLIGPNGARPIPVPGIDIASRDELGLSPFIEDEQVSSGFLRVIFQFGIQAGSLLSFANSPELENLYPSQQEIAIKIAVVLRQQGLE